MAGRQKALSPSLWSCISPHLCFQWRCRSMSGPTCRSHWWRKLSIMESVLFAVRRIYEQIDRHGYVLHVGLAQASPNKHLEINAKASTISCNEPPYPVKFTICAETHPNGIKGCNRWNCKIIRVCIQALWWQQWRQIFPSERDISSASAALCSALGFLGWLL